MMIFSERQKLSFIRERLMSVDFSWHFRSWLSNGKLEALLREKADRQWECKQVIYANSVRIEYHFVRNEPFLHLVEHRSDITSIWPFVSCHTAVLLLRIRDLLLHDCRCRLRWLSYRTGNCVNYSNIVHCGLLMCNLPETQSVNRWFFSQFIRVNRFARDALAFCANIIASLYIDMFFFFALFCAHFHLAEHVPEQ